MLRLEASATGFYWHGDLCLQLPLAQALGRWESWNADCPDFLIWEKASPLATPTSLSPPLSISFSCLYFLCYLFLSYLSLLLSLSISCLYFLCYLFLSSLSLFLSPSLSSPFLWLFVARAAMHFPAFFPSSACRHQLPLSPAASLFPCVSQSPLSPLSSAPLISCMVSCATWQFLLSHPVTLLSWFSHYSLQPCRLCPARLLCPWDSPDKNTGVACHSLPQGNLPDPGTKPASPALAGGFFTAGPPGKPPCH